MSENMTIEAVPAALRNTNGLINGLWVSGKSSFPDYNPANGDLLAEITAMGAEETVEAVAAADQAFRSWSKLTVAARVAAIYRWAQEIRNHSESLALLMTLEQGKPLAEAKGEWLHGARCLEWYAEEAQRVHGSTLPSNQENQRNLTISQPVGVMAAVTPWNFPAVSILVKCGAAITAGCTVVLKPSEETPLCASAIAELALAASIPAGVLNVIPANDPASVGDVLTQDPRVKMLSFTGSTAVGRLLNTQAAPTIKKVAMELGGNAPFIVFEDADLEAAACALVGARFYNNGQICIGANRILVHESVHETFIKLLVEKVSKITTGDGTQAGHQCGPMINTGSMDKLERLVADAVEQGGQVVVGGHKKIKDTLFYLPTVITNLSPSMAIWSEEVFGPVAPIYSFSSEEEALDLANNTDAGLAAYFYSGNMSRCWRVAEALEVGMVGCNTSNIALLDIPFGGIKQSGNGREGGIGCLAEYLEVKSISFGM